MKFLTFSFFLFFYMNLHACVGIDLATSYTIEQTINGDRREKRIKRKRRRRCHRAARKSFAG